MVEPGFRVNRRRGASAFTHALALGCAAPTEAGTWDQARVNVDPENHSENDSQNQTRARRRGRAVGLGLFITVVTLFTLVCSVQIIRQTWQSAGPKVALECRTGLKDLVTAIRRARRAAAAEPQGERAALARFREALRPEWQLRQAIEKNCGPDRSALRALREIDRLRYAEEHAVRYEAVDLARQRRRVMSLEKQLF